MSRTVEPDGRPSRSHDEPDGDPAIVLVHPLQGPSTQVVLTLSAGQASGFRQLLSSRSLPCDLLAERDRSGLVELRVDVGDDPRSVDDVADCLEIFLQLLGRAVFGQVANPSLVDVARQGRNVVAEEVGRAFDPLRPFLPCP
ncbi:hypothetical protein [Solicola sp. PLA-1-18]|uniref:hypothetical protein n=1 Tax=Solicola sp. PLA-1-18 TaxID=3380532 RepID=UPI003B799218